MRRANFDFTVTINVDGIVQDQRTIWVHEQRDPLPGGHHFEAVLQGASLSHYLRGLPPDVTSRCDARTANDFLHRLYAALEVPEGVPRFTFVLNTVDSVHTDGSVVRITGECSPYVHRQANLHPGA